MCVPYLLSSVHEMDCLREETVPVSDQSGVQSSVALTRRLQFEEIDVRFQCDASPFAHFG